MKPAFKSQIFSYIIIRLLLSCVVIGVFILGCSSVIADIVLVVVISIPFAFAMCLLTTLMIFRRVNSVLAVQLSKIRESASILAKVSLNFTKTAEGIRRNTYIMKDVARLLGEVADDCDEADKEDDSSKSA